MNEFLSRIKIMAIGVDQYDDPAFKKLQGTKADIKNLRNVLVEDPKTALFHGGQFTELINPSSDKLRKELNEYVLGRSAEGDILIFYFSGHGVSIGRDDFGFCTTDTVIHPLSKVVLPLSIVKFSELMTGLRIANVIPVVIIDACYSGIAGKNLFIPPLDAIDSVQHQIHYSVASSFALLCSCAENQTTIDLPSGGVFSKFLFETAHQGIKTKNFVEPLLTLEDIFPTLQEKTFRYSGDIIPRLFLGVSLPKFPLFMNTKYKITKISLSPQYVNIVKALWNNGEALDA